MSRFLVDNSVLQRLPRSIAVQVAVTAVLDEDHELCCCALSLRLLPNPDPPGGRPQHMVLPDASEPSILGYTRIRPAIGQQPRLDEFAFSARSAADHAAASTRLRRSFLYLPFSPDIDQIIIDIRTALWTAGTGRAAGVIDVALAAIAVHAGATALHYDRDFDHIAAAYPRLAARWVVTPGSVD